MQTLYDALVASGLSALNAAGPIPQAAEADRFEVGVEFGAGTSAGTVVIESSHDPAFAGTWHVEATIAWAALSSYKHASIVGPRRALRYRVSVAVVGGSVSIYAKASKG